MDKMKLKFWVDFFMLLALLGTATTGLINLYLLDTSKEALFSVSLSTWLFAHPIFGVTTVLFVVFHLFLHMDWIAAVSKKIFGNKEQAP